MKERDEFYRLEPRKHSLNLFVEHIRCGSGHFGLFFSSYKRITG